MATDWYIRRGEKQLGPITESELRRQLSSHGNLSGLQVRQGASAWFGAQEVHRRLTELAELGLYIREGGVCTGPFTPAAILKLHSSGKLAHNAKMRQGKSGSWIDLEPAIAALEKFVDRENRAIESTVSEDVDEALRPTLRATLSAPCDSIPDIEEDQDGIVVRYFGAIVAGLMCVLICMIAWFGYFIVHNSESSPQLRPAEADLALVTSDPESPAETTSSSNAGNVQPVSSEEPVVPQKSVYAMKFENTRILVTTNTGDLWLYHSAVVELDDDENLKALVCRAETSDTGSSDTGSSENELREVVWAADEVALVQSIPSGEYLYGDSQLKDRFLSTKKSGGSALSDTAGVRIVNRTGQPICVSEKEPGIFDSVGGVRLLNGQGFHIARSENSSAIERMVWVNSRRGTVHLKRSFSAGDNSVWDIMPIDLQANQANRACSVLGDFSDWNPNLGTMWIGQANYTPSLHKIGTQTLTTLIRFVPITEKVSLGIVNLLWGDEELVGRFVATELDEIDPNVFKSILGRKVSAKIFEFTFVGSDDFLSRLNLSPKVKAKLFNGTAGKALFLDSSDRPATAMFGVGNKFTSIAVFCAPGLPVIETLTVSNASRREANWAFKQATVPGQVYDTHYTDKVIAVSKDWWSDNYIAHYESYSVPRNVDFDQPWLTFQGEYTNHDAVDRDVSFLVSITPKPDQLNGSPVNHFVFSRRIPAGAKTQMGSSLEIKNAWQSGAVSGLDFFFREFQDATNNNENWGISGIQSVKVLPLKFDSDGSKMFDANWLRLADPHIPKSRWNLPYGGDSVYFGADNSLVLYDESCKIVDIYYGKVIRSFTSEFSDLGNQPENSSFSLPAFVRASNAPAEVKRIKKLVLPASLSRYNCSLKSAEISKNGKHMLFSVHVQDRGFLLLSIDSNDFGKRLANPLDAPFRLWKAADGVTSSERLRLEAYEDKQFLFRRESDLTELRVPIVSIDADHRKQAIIWNAKHRPSSKRRPKNELVFPTTVNLQIISPLTEYVMKHGIAAMAVSNSGQVFIANDEEDQQRLFWSQENEKARVLTVPISRVTGLAFRDDGSIAALSEQQVCLLDKAGGGVLSRITFEKDPTQTILLVDQHYVFRHRSDEAELIEIDTGGIVAKLACSDTPLSVSFRHDRKRIAIAGVKSTIVQNLQLKNPIDFVRLVKE